MVAHGRALADAGVSHVPGFSDPTARAFFEPKTLARLDKLSEKLRDGTGGMRHEFARTMADVMALRTAVIDAAVKEAVAGGTRQLVILGAGLDGRAWRMRELAGVRVFEVDHPATQTFKRSKVGALPPAIGDVTFVAVNFERESLESALQTAGHDASRTTCWIWEGVVMYLTRDAMRSTLANIASRSAEGSTLIVNYHTTVRRGLMGIVFRLLGEPMRSEWQPDTMASDLGAAGFRVQDDSGISEWAKRFANGPVRLSAGAIMRIVVARRGTV